jgi:peptide methionine sulfoxide reductase msrA/msrB
MPLRIKAAILAAATLITLTGWRGLNALMRGGPAPTESHELGEKPMSRKVHKSEDEWKAVLTPLQYHVMRERGTEAPFTGDLNDNYAPGTYVCAACGAPLFSSAAKYDQGTGWPSFTSTLDERNLEFLKDSSFLLDRVEVRCASCGAHLGHLFDDGPAPAFEHYCINSASLRFKPAPGAVRRVGSSDGPEAQTTEGDKSVQTATFAAGCFWGVESKFSHRPGVLSTRVGYTGGTVAAPSYAQVCTDRTGHAEAVELTFDPAQVSYEDLVRFFFTIHDPTQVDRQGPDLGTQYRSVIFYHSQVQRAVAEKVLAELNASGRYQSRLATGLVPAGEFYPAEEYHQKYYEKHKSGACAY